MKKKLKEVTEDITNNIYFIQIFLYWEIDFEYIKTKKHNNTKLESLKKKDYKDLSSSMYLPWFLILPAKSQTQVWILVFCF